MIGGGPGSLIGGVHRIAANIDGQYDLVCGSFSSDPAKSNVLGQELFLDPDRVYADYAEMFRSEAGRPVSERMEVVSIVTPNHLHFEPAKLALEAGFHVILDKPMTFDMAEARELERVAGASGLLFCLTHTYTGYPMIKEARNQVLSGKFGAIRKVYVEYPQGWLSSFAEGSENKQAGWRTDPKKSGIAGSVGDIGTHAFNLAEYVACVSLTHLCADVRTIVPGRRLDDDATVLLRFEKGVSGLLVATQIAAGEENNFHLRIYGEKGGLEWMHRDPNSLLIKWPDKPMETWRTGTGYVSSYAAENTRVPAGHPEGYLEAFANLYRNFARTLVARQLGSEPSAESLDFPGLEEGIRGMRFIERVIESGKSDSKWIEF